MRKLSSSTSKYYAVKTGRVPGIYQSWPGCKQQANPCLEPHCVSGWPLDRDESVKTICTASQDALASARAGAPVQWSGVQSLHRPRRGGKLSARHSSWGQQGWQQATDSRRGTARCCPGQYCHVQAGRLADCWASSLLLSQSSQGMRNCWMLLLST